ncbi:hypothetical protein AB1N83_003393 [Pleurotus pulmonarius]
MAALSDNSGYCETCSVHNSTNSLIRLYDGATFYMICQACYSAQHHRVKAGNPGEHRRVFYTHHVNMQLRYKCTNARFGCPEGNNHAEWMVFEHSRTCKWASKVTCTECWQSMPVIDYAAHTNGKGDLWI